MRTGRECAGGARGPGAPLEWTYNPPLQRAAQGVACCDVVNRGAAYTDGKIFFNTLDDQTVAVDARTGREVWRVRLGNINQGETMTMAPIVVKGRVLVGNSGGEMGVRGWLTALDEETGRTVWRAYGTGPDADVLIGPGFHPFYAKDRGTDLGVKSWPAGAWKIGGGNVWGWISYDPELDLVYYGTGNPGPWNPDARTGKLLWRFRTSSGIVGQPITYRGPDGKQYVAIFSGVGGWAGAVVSGDLSPADPTAAPGFVGAMRELPRHTREGGTLYVFALP
ncbi:MAG TPA: PQQ-binding-like beta-propeller repeat protein [Longimicrobiaceae bacterium]|nr:PQQ-binding-like beta-propeller repeat protein [Longimicrobiaceae bacterium]